MDCCRENCVLHNASHPPSHPSTHILSPSFKFSQIHWNEFLAAVGTSTQSLALLVCVDCFLISLILVSLDALYVACVYTACLSATHFITITTASFSSVESQGLITMGSLGDAFDRIDSDGKGYISRDDLKNILGDNYREDVVDRMLDEADYKKNGQVRPN